MPGLYRIVTTTSESVKGGAKLYHLGGVGILALAAVVTIVLRVFDVVIAGVPPDAWALTAMMTAPFTVGVVSLFTLVATLVAAARLGILMLGDRRPVWQFARP